MAVAGSCGALSGRRMVPTHVGVDHNKDFLYLRLNEAAIAESEEVRPGLFLEYDAEHYLVGIEVLGLSRIAPLEIYWKC